MKRKSLLHKKVKEEQIKAVTPPDDSSSEDDVEDREEDSDDVEVGMEKDSDVGDDSEEDDDSQSESDSGEDGEEEEEEAEEGETQDGSEPPHKRAKLSNAALYKPPTNEEMHQLKETESLFHSSLFRLQITEMLKEIQLKGARRKQMNKAVQTLTTILTGLPAGQQREIQDQKWLKSCRVPLIQKPAVQGVFQFLPPQEVKVTGSFLSDTCIKPDIHVDLMVVMPKDCFCKQDFLNHRYLCKRALYLSALANKLQKQDSIETLKFTYHHGHHMKPILVATVKVEGHKPVKVNLHAVPEQGSFSLPRFHVCKNNVRPKWFHGTKPTADSTVKEFPDTPLHNSLVLQDVAMERSRDCLQKVEEGSSGVKEGIALLKVWLRQRELHTGYSCFSSYIMCMYVVYLLRSRKLKAQMSSYQVMRNTLLELSRTDWTRDNLTLCSDTGDKHQPTLEDFRSKFDLVFVDVTGYLNLCAGLDLSVYNRIKHEAKVAMDILEDKTINSFEMLFMKKVPFTQKFDHVLHISNTQDMQKCVAKFEAEDKLMDRGGHSLYTCVPGIVALLEKGLGRRVKLIQVKLKAPEQWDITAQPPDHGSPSRLTLGLLLNEEFAFNCLDRGPSADKPEAQAFREFWGKKSELRRFQDGGICEAVLWADNTTVSNKRAICSSVATFLLDRHANIHSSALSYVGGQLDEILKLNVSFDAKDALPYGTGEEQSVDLTTAYDKLRKILRSLSDLPLKINTIQGVCPALRGSEVFTPLPATFCCQELQQTTSRYLPQADKRLPPYTEALKVVCVLEGSGKWPDDLQAMRRLKAAFNLQLADTLEKKHCLKCKVAVDRVDVLMSGYVFRLVLAYLKEITLMKAVKENNLGITKVVTTDDALRLERDIVTLPKLSSTLLGIQQQFESYSGSVRLAKRWITSQLLGDYIQEIVVELIMAAVYLSPHPFTAPGSAMAGFIRFLHLLATFDWKTTPLLVNLNHEFTDEDLIEIPQKFTKERATLPLMFLSTPLDKFSSHWTKKTPTVPILQRLVLLAQRSLLHVQNQIIEAEKPVFKAIFRPPLEVYDVLIHLLDKSLPRHHEAVDISDKAFIPKYCKTAGDALFPVTDFDPVQMYLKELEAAFSDYALFFHDKHGGNVIGILWKPKMLAPKEFKVSHINGSMPHTASGDKEVQLVPNMEGLLETMKVLGGGLFSKLETKTARSK